MPDPKVLYVFTRGERGIFEEVYFPKKVVHQPAVFRALREGLNPENVKGYLRDEVKTLLQELKDYRGLFDPHQYEKDSRKKFQPTPEQAAERINMYESSFKGWTMKEADGVWLDDDEKSATYGEAIEERTQIIRIIFRLPLEKPKVEGVPPNTMEIICHEALEKDYFDILRSMLFWCITNQGNLDEHVWWGKAEQRRFISRHKPWPTKKKLAFAEKYFSPVAREVSKWRDDCALFIYGYLVKKFAESVLKEKRREEVIWVTSFFNLTINEIKRVEQPS